MDFWADKKDGKFTCCQQILTTAVFFIRKLLTHIKLVEKRLKVKNGAMRSKQRAVEGKPSVCSRAHTFLQR